MRQSTQHGVILGGFVCLILLSLGGFYYLMQSRGQSGFFRSNADLSQASHQVQFEVFPFNTTKHALQTTVVGYNYNCRQFCHDTYEAADIGGTPGQVVRAITGGEVIGIEQAATVQGQPAGASLRFRTEGGWYIYYVHLKAHSLEVKEGQQILAGQVVGVLGGEDDAQQAAPHLHIDVSAVDNGFSRGAGLCNQACHQLVAPQPMLRTAYDALMER